ncbi:MAG: cyclic nucleotide-binding domain-containing protein [Deltaproteobacteria bacterium]|nr:cyclic nucleotide-binding domain-containing protein [Deltaproteobacteria bacterium]
MDASLFDDAGRFLLEIPVFGGMEPGPLRRVLEQMDVRRYPSGAAVCAEGEPGRELFILREGEAEVRKRTDEGHAVLARLGVGDCFGEMSLIDVQPRSAAVVTLVPATLYVLSNAGFYALYRQDLAGYAFLVQNLCRELSRRLRKTSATLAEFELQRRRSDAPAG